MSTKSSKSDRFGRPHDLRPRFTEDGVLVPEDATYIGLGERGRIVSAVFSATPPKPRTSGSKVCWVPAHLVNLGDTGL